MILAVLSNVSSGEASRAPSYLIGAVGVQNGPALKLVNSAVPYLLARLNSIPSLPDPTVATRERNIITRARYAAGISQAGLAWQFGTSYQRVH